MMYDNIASRAGTIDAVQIGSIWIVQAPVNCAVQYPDRKHYRSHHALLDASQYVCRRLSVWLLRMSIGLHNAAGVLTLTAAYRDRAGY